MESATSWDGTIDFIRHIREEVESETSSVNSIELDTGRSTKQLEDNLLSDSDLEEYLHPVSSTQVESYTEIYTKACSDLKVIPCSPFLRQICDEEIDISHYNIGPKGTKAAAKVLKRNTITTLLNISDNGVDVGGAKALAGMLSENCFITVLDLSMNFIKEAGVEAICVVLESNKYIIELSLESTRVNDSASVFIANALKENTTLRLLNLGSNEIGEEGGVALASGIAENYGVFDLDLSGNHIRNKGAVAIAGALGMNSMLQSIDLSRNGFADNGAKALGEALKVNDTLRELYLAENRLSINGAWGLGIGLEQNAYLKVLKLCGNPMHSRGAVLLIQSLILNVDSVLSELYINDVSVSSDFESVLNELLQQRPGLHVQFGKVIRGKEHRRRGKQQKVPCLFFILLAILISMYENWRNGVDCVLLSERL